MIKLFHKNSQNNGNNQSLNPAQTTDTQAIQKTSLKDKIIPKHLLNIIPAAIAQKYSAVFFEESNDILKLAVGHPEKLKNNFGSALDNIEKKLHKKIELYQVNPDEIKEVFNPQLSFRVDDDRLPDKKIEEIKTVNLHEVSNNLETKPDILRNEDNKESKDRAQDNRIDAPHDNKLISDTPTINTKVEEHENNDSQNANKEQISDKKPLGLDQVNNKFEEKINSDSSEKNRQEADILNRKITQDVSYKKEFGAHENNLLTHNAYPITITPSPNTANTKVMSHALDQPPSISPTPIAPNLPISAIPKISQAPISSNIPTVSFPALPKLYIQGEIPYEVFSHIPYFFAENHRLICIDFIPPNKYSMAAEQPNSPETQVIINYLKKNNDFDFRLYQANPREFDFLLREYKTQETKKANLLQKQKIQLNKDFSKHAKDKAKIGQISKKFKKQPLLTNPQPKINETIRISQPKLAEGVISPDIKGKIVSGEKEKVGFSGALEKIGSLFSAPKVTSSENIEPLELKPGRLTLSSSKHLSESPIHRDIPKEIKVQEVPSVETSAEPTEQTPKETEKKDQGIKTDENLGSLLKKDIRSIDELKEIVKENNIPKLVAAIVSYAISQNASDIHAEPFEDELLIRYRIDGQLRNIIKLPPDMHAPLISRIKILSKLKLDETRIPQDGRFNVVFSTREVDLRVSTMPAVHGEKGVLRILDKTKGVISLENLGFLGMGFDVLIDSINRPYGIIIATGPTGSGKSTTLYAILARVATSTVNVITLEDPVEYEMKGINQSQINPKIGYTFADGLRSILRQDPNIIMVGEIRDGETANMATQAALTGHLVLTTLHTNNASGALPRLINMGIEPFLITSSINAIIGQRLVRKICDSCKEEINLPEGVVKEVEDELSKISPVNKKDQDRIKRPFKFYQGKGCDKCHNTGYSGRIGLYEILPMSEKIEELTINRATANQMLDQAVKEGMITMKQDGILKVLAGITTLDEILKETSEK